MELVTDAAGNVAPRLADVEFSEAMALDYHAQLMRQVVLMLCAGIVHGDLSEYNIMVDAHGPVIIDLPRQSMLPATTRPGRCWSAMSTIFRLTSAVSPRGWRARNMARKSGACPDGRGTVRLASSDPLAPPAVLFDYLRTDYDMQAVIFGIRLCRKIAEQPALKPYHRARNAAWTVADRRRRPRALHSPERRFQSASHEFMRDGSGAQHGR